MANKDRQPPVKVAYSDEEEAEDVEHDLDDALMARQASLLPRQPHDTGLNEDTGTPCTISGLGSGVSAGAMGAIFGGGGQMIRHRGPGRWKAVRAEGFQSAKTFALMGGLYSVVSCFSKRFRQKDDAWNGFASGCATGIALGWGGTPMAVTQSALGFGLFSFAIDYIGTQRVVPPASAVSSTSPCLVSAHTSGQRRQGLPWRCNSCSIAPRQAAPAADLQPDVPPPLRQMMLSPCFTQPLLTPSAMWLQPLQAVAKKHLH